MPLESVCPVCFTACALTACALLAYDLTAPPVMALQGEASDETTVAGGKGARGEITRRPGESGNPYGVSVFVDEYGKWGSAIQGMPLTETRARMQTKYFP